MVPLHWPFGNVCAAWRVLEEYNEAGKIRAIGVSNMEADRLIDLITFNKVKPALNQIETHLYCQRQAASVAGEVWCGASGICAAWAGKG